MKQRQLAIKLIKDKLNGNTFLTYKEIAETTGYHPKYILKLRDEIVNNNISLVHGNTNRTPVNAMS